MKSRLFPPDCVAHAVNSIPGCVKHIAASLGALAGVEFIKNFRNRIEWKPLRFWYQLSKSGSLPAPASIQLMQIVLSPNRRAALKRQKQGSALEPSSRRSLTTTRSGTPPARPARSTPCDSEVMTANIAWDWYQYSTAALRAPSLSNSDCFSASAGATRHSSGHCTSQSMPCRV
jgi:hypothetical protein